MNFTLSRIIFEPSFLYFIVPKGETFVRNANYGCRSLYLGLTLVIPIAPMFSLYDVVPFPLPKAPAKRHPIPSIPIPRLIACFGGGGAPDNLAQA